MENQSNRTWGGLHLETHQIFARPIESKIEMGSVGITVLGVLQVFEFEQWIIKPLSLCILDDDLGTPSQSRRINKNSNGVDVERRDIYILSLPLDAKTAGGGTIDDGGVALSDIRPRRR